jgi:hypothetical protein
VPTIFAKVLVATQVWVTKSHFCNTPELHKTANSALVGCAATSAMPVAIASRTTLPLRLVASNSSKHAVWNATPAGINY